MTALIGSDDYETIRKLLDVSLNDGQLPDSTIGLDIYQGAAIADVLELHPTAESETGTDLLRCKRAAAYFCAARLAPAVVRITSLTIQARDLNYARPVFDPEKRAAELRALAQAEITEVLTPTEQAGTRPTMFVLATGNRGR